MNKFSLPRFLLLTVFTVFFVTFFAALYVSLNEGWHISWPETLKMALVSSGLLSLLTGSLVAAIVSLIGIIFMLFKTANSRKEGISTFDRRLLFNPFNTVFFPKHLTDEGLAARKKLFHYVVILVIAILGGFIVGLMTKIV